MFRQSACCYCRRSLPDCRAYGVRQTWMPPTPGLPRSRHHLTAYKHGNLCDPSFLQVPFRPHRKFPVPENRMTYPLPEYASYPDVPVNRNRYDAMSPNPSPENIRGLPAQNKVPAPYVLSIRQSGHDPPFSDSLDQI